jgi:hypothetical protein
MPKKKAREKTQPEDPAKAKIARDAERAKMTRATDTQNDIDALEAQRATFEQDQRLRKQYEREKPELAPWIGWEEYREARRSEARIRAYGIVGAYMAGKKREEIRKLYRISPNKLNAILNSQVVDDILSYALGHIYSFQNAAVKAILWQLTRDHDGHLAMALLDKMGLFDRMGRLLDAGVPDTAGKGADEQKGIFGALIAGSGNDLQTRQAADALGQFVVQTLKGAADRTGPGEHRNDL